MVHRTRKKTTRRRKSPRSKAPNSKQKNLQARTKAPWERIKALGLTKPTVYLFDFQKKPSIPGLTTTYLPSIGFVGEYNEDGKDYFCPEYSWMYFCQQKARGESDHPHPSGEHPDMFTLRPDQEEDVETILNAQQAGAPGFLIANGTGVGKTVTAWSSVLRMHPDSVLIVCPAPVIASWRQHIKDMGDGGAHIVITSYESLKSMVKPSDRAINARSEKTQNKYLASDSEGYTTFDMLVLDETHKLKDPTSQRSKITRSFGSHASFTLRLSATPGKDPASLHYLYEELSWATGDQVAVSDKKGLSDYVQWCAKHGISGLLPAPFGNGLKWEGNPEEIDAFSHMIYDTEPRWAIKRVPEHWDDVVRQPLPLDMKPKDRKAYELVVQDAFHALSDYSRSMDRHDTSHGIAALTSLRQKTGMIKVEECVNYARYCIEDLGEQVVLSAFYENTVELLEKMLTEAKITYCVVTGKSNADEKEDARRRFQRGEVDAMVTSVTTGISLHAGEDSVGGNMKKRRMIIVDAQWSPIEHLQLEGRINRNGQSGIITIPYLNDSLDEKIMRTLIRGLTTMSGIQQNPTEADQLHLLADTLGISLDN